MFFKKKYLAVSIKSNIFANRIYKRRMITIVKDKEPIYDTDKFDVVLVGVSTHNMLMGNFQGKMGVKYPIVERVNNSTPYGDLRKLGKRVTINDTKPIISLMYICKYPSRKENFIDYEALRNCLKTANSEFKGKKVITTVLGSTQFDGKGDKEECLKIIEETTKDLDLYVYDFEPITIKEEIKRQNRYFTQLKKDNRKDRNMLKKINEMAMKMREKTFLPTNMYNKGKNRQNDDILNF